MVRPDHDTNLNRLVPPVQTNYRIHDITDRDNPVELEFWVYNAGLNEGPPAQRRDPLAPFDWIDTILLREPAGVNGADILTWMYQPGSIDTNLTLPVGGEILEAVTRKPFTGEDTFSYRVQAPAFDRSAAARSLKDVRVVPNPYLATATWEPKPIKGNRGARNAVHPSATQATVRVYDPRRLVKHCTMTGSMGRQP